MSLSTLVVARSTGTFGTFEVKDGNVTKASKAVLVFFNITTALVPMDARSSFTTADEHTAFDATLMALSTAGTPIQYVDSISKFMDPTARFNEFLAGTLTPKSVGLTLTPEELAVPTAYESAKAKFEALFKAPTPPRLFDERNLSDGEKLTITRTRDGKPTKLKNRAGYEIGVAAAKKLWDSKLDKAWIARKASNGGIELTGSSYISAGGYTDRRFRIYATYIEIGCQTIQRNAIEAVAQELGWIS